MDILGQKIFSKIKSVGILPVVCLKTEAELETFTKALLQTNIRCIEIIMRHPFCYEAIKYFKREHPEFVVGAGTIVSSDVLNKVLELGVDFCVSPGFDEDIIREAMDKNIPFLPGCSTPSEFLKAKKYNMNTVKLFPAECAGGVNALKLYEGAFSGMSFLTTGGIDLKNYLEFMACNNVIACGGSFMIPDEMLQSNDIQGISNTVNDCVAAIKEIRRK